MCQLAGVWHNMENFSLKNFRDFVLLAIAITGIILLSSNVFAANILPPTPLNNCWDFVACESYLDATTNPEDDKEICIISNLTISHSDTNAIIIEILQGRVNSDSPHYFIYNDGSAAAGVRDYFFEMSKDTAPTYILCSMYNPLQTGHYTAGKLGIIDRWMSTTEIEHTTTKEYTNLIADDTNWFMYGITLFMFIIGLLLVFTTVIQYYNRKK
jgi:hypothetical protein